MEQTPQYRVTLWHGTMVKSLMEKLSGICDGKRNSEGDFMFSGTIDDFAVKWGEKFVCFPDVKIIGVTQYNTFGSR